ncbi:MAG: phosphotransferase [Clostridia bacterium]|nr:phosphotransferase [Clostridia bacterium]
MLKLKYLIENFELAKHCIGYWEHDEASLAETLPWFRISSNAVYPFRQAQGLCFLRLSPAAEKTLAEVEDETAAALWLREKGFPAMEPVPMRDGRYCALLSTPWGSYTACCFRQVAGQPLESFPASRELIEGYGRTLGQLHRDLADCSVAGLRRSWRELLASARQQLIDHRAPEAMLACCDTLHSRLNALPPAPERYGLIHYDFEPDNVFFDPCTGQYAVIDFDDMIVGWYALDVIRALDGLEDLSPGGVPMSPEEQRDCFLRGYRSRHPFSAADEAALPLMRSLVQLVEYAGLMHVLAENLPAEPEWMAGLRQRLASKMQALEQLLSR